MYVYLFSFSAIFILVLLYTIANTLLESDNVAYGTLSSTNNSAFISDILTCFEHPCSPTTEPSIITSMSTMPNRTNSNVLIGASFTYNGTTSDKLKEQKDTIKEMVVGYINNTIDNIVTASSLTPGTNCPRIDDLSFCIGIIVWPPICTNNTQFNDGIVC
jgi:hypothetical protein